MWSLSSGTAAERRNKQWQQLWKKRYPRQERVKYEWDNEDINPHIPEGHSCVQDVHLAGWLAGWVAGLLIQPACTPQTDVWPAKPAAPQAVCVLEKPRADASTWCPTRLPLHYYGYASVAITWPQNWVFRLCAVNHTDDKVEWARDWWISSGRLSMFVRVHLTGWIGLPDRFD